MKRFAVKITTEEEKALLISMAKGFHCDQDVNINDHKDNYIAFYIDRRAWWHRIDPSLVTYTLLDFYKDMPKIAELLNNKYIMVGKYAVRFRKNNITIGCLTISKDKAKKVQHIADLMVNAALPKGIAFYDNGDVSYQGEKCDYETMKKIYKELD